jgi:hypothetical protein
VNKILSTIEKIREYDLQHPWPSGVTVEAIVRSASGSHQGARLGGLSTSVRALLADLGVVGANGGLTAHGANVRARLVTEQLDRLMPL